MKDAKVILVAATVSIGIAIAAHYVLSKPSVVITTTTSVTKLDRNSRYAQRLNESVWPELDQPEVNELATIHQGIPETDRALVSIFCADETKCGDLQLDFENAFVKAKWAPRLERPLIDTTAGLSTSSKEIAQAIEEATQGSCRS
jgi:hypothetical protein